MCEFDKKIFSERLKSLRDESVKAKDVAEYIGITKQSYSLLEKGENAPSAPTLFLIALFFNVSADYLLGLSDDPERK